MSTLLQKAAGQELLSANYVGSYSPFIKVPLMAVIDYWGHRLSATALLPIEEHSLVYGSSDGGKTVVSANETVSQADEFFRKRAPFTATYSRIYCNGFMWRY